MTTKPDRAMESQHPNLAEPDGAVAIPRRRSASLKLLGIFVLFAAGIIAASISYFRCHKQSYCNEVNKQLSAIAELKVNELTQWREDRKGDASLFFKNSSFSALVRRFFEKPDDTDAQRQIQDWLGKYSIMEDYDQVRLLDTQAVTRLSIPRGITPASSDTVLAVSEALQLGQITIRDFYRHEQNQRNYLSVQVPLSDETQANRPLGVVVLRINPEKYLYPFLHSWPTPSATAETQLVRQEGNDVVFLSDTHLQTNTVYGLRISLKNTAVLGVKAVLGQTGILSGEKDYRGVPVIAAIQKVPDSPWVLVAKIDCNEILAPLHVQLWQLILLIIVLLLGVGAGVMLFWRQQRIRFYREKIIAAEKLLTSVSQYRELFELSADALFLIDNDTSQILDVNTMAVVLYGYERDELLAKQNRDLLAPHEESMLPLQEAHLKLGQVFNSPMRWHRKKDGTVFPVEINTRSLSREGKYVFLMACRDITDRQRVEAVLNNERLQLRTLIDNLPYFIYFKDMECRFVVANKTLAQRMGVASADVLTGCDDAKFFPADFARLYRDDDLRVMREGIGIYRKEERSLLASDEEMRWVATTKVPIKNTAGNVIGLVGIGIDITDRKRTENYLEMRREIVQLLNEPGGFSDAIKHVITALKTRTGFDAVGLRLQAGDDFPYYVQQGFPEEFLLTENTLIVRGEDGSVCRDNDGNACLECTCGLVISGKTDPSAPLFTKGGSFWTNDSLPLLGLPSGQDSRYHPRNRCMLDGYISVALIPVRDKERIIGLIHLNDRRKDCFTLETVELLESIALYIGEALMRRQAEKVLHDMAESKIKFTSTVSHELRSPLAMIKEATNLVLDGVLGPLNDGQKEMLDISKHNIARLGRLVNNVLEYQKMGAGKTGYDFLENDVNALVKEAHINAALYASERKADVMMELGSDLPRIKFDKDKIMQVLINLLANAIKYSESGPVVVRTRLEKNEIQISVRDSGQGIQPEELGEIFKPFVQAKGKKKGGTGLGLAIAKEIVLAHHGKIWVESEIEKGSIFYFTLPV